MKVLARSAEVLHAADRAHAAIDRELATAEARDAVTWLEDTFNEALRRRRPSVQPDDLLDNVHIVRDGWGEGDIYIRPMASFEPVPGYPYPPDAGDGDFWHEPARWPVPGETYHDLDYLAEKYGPDAGQLLDKGALRASA